MPAPVSLAPLPALNRKGSIMDYRIIEANAATGQIVVEYSSGGEVVGKFAIDVPIVDGAYVTGAALDAEIALRAPTWVVERKAAVESATNFSEIEALVTSN
jgi:hypothetical protein